MSIKGRASPVAPSRPPNRRRNRFRERELARALRAARSAGGVTAVRIDESGAIVLVLDNKPTADTPEEILSKL
jgi:hypothetical protein